MELPETFWMALRLVGGFVVFLIGISFAKKFFEASFMGKMVYWSGLQPFGLLFAPLTWLVTPLLVHLPYDPKNSLMKEQQNLWIHLTWGPVFFVLTLMFLTSGADLMGLPGSTSLNYVLTGGNNPAIPPCIVYEPPCNYRFPFVKKAKKTVLKFLTQRVQFDKKDSYNAYEAGGTDVEQYSKMGDWLDDDDDKPKVAPVSNVTPTPAPTASKGSSRKHR